MNIYRNDLQTRNPQKCNLFVLVFLRKPLRNDCPHRHSSYSAPGNLGEQPQRMCPRLLKIKYLYQFLFSEVREHIFHCRRNFTWCKSGCMCIITEDAGQRSFRVKLHDFQLQKINVMLYEPSELSEVEMCCGIALHKSCSSVTQLVHSLQFKSCRYPGYIPYSL